MNVYDEHPFRLILDYAHNIDGLEKLGKFVQKQQVSGSTVLMFAAPGDRRDDGIMKVGLSAGSYFDHYICRSYYNLRGRASGEVPTLMKQGFRDVDQFMKSSFQSFSLGISSSKPGYSW